MAASFTDEELLKVIATLNEALEFAKKTQNDKVEFGIARDACIQRFEYCIELAWKVAMKAIGSLTKFPKQAVREMARADLIDSAEVWLDFIEARNVTSHSYDENIAQKVFIQIIKFSTDVVSLVNGLQALK